MVTIIVIYIRHLIIIITRAMFGGLLDKFNCMTNQVYLITLWKNILCDGWHQLHDWLTRDNQTDLVSFLCFEK